MNSKRAINRWQKENYHTLTQFLLAHKMKNILRNYDLNEEYMDWTKALNSVMKYEHIKRNVYRGLKSKYIINDELISYAFTAASKSIEKASEFGDIVVMFQIPEHIKSHTFENEGEKEVLIERNTKLKNFVFTGDYINNKKVYVATLVKYRNHSNAQPNTERNTRNLSTKLNNLKKLYNSSNENSNFNN